MYRSSAVVAMVFLALLAGGGAARAQEAGRVGLAAGYPASIGLVWHASDSLALRPEFSVSRLSGESRAATGSTLTTSSGTSLGVGASALWYVKKWDSVSAYVSPRFAYGRTTSDSHYSGAGTGGPITQSTASTYSFTGSFGAQCSLARRLAVFGEAGFGYSHQRSTYDSASFISSSYTTRNTTNTWSTRTAVGIVFYF